MGSVASTVIVPSLFVTNTNKLEFNSKDYLVYLHKIWMNTVNQTPYDYLSKLDGVLLRPQAYEHYVKQDFIVGEVIEIDGVVLSKTEAAAMAMLAEIQSA